MRRTGRGRRCNAAGNGGRVAARAARQGLGAAVGHEECIEIFAAALPRGVPTLLQILLQTAATTRYDLASRVTTWAQRSRPTSAQAFLRDVENFLHRAPKRTIRPAGDARRRSRKMAKMYINFILNNLLLWALKHSVGQPARVCWAHWTPDNVA